MAFYLISHTICNGLLLLWMFYLRLARLSYKRLWQGYVNERLKLSLRKFYGQYTEYIKQYKVTIYQMLHDILGHDLIQWYRPLIFHLLVTLLPYWIFNRHWPHYQIRRGSIEHLQRVQLANIDAYSSGQLVLSNLGLAFVHMLRPVSHERVIFRTFRWISNIFRFRGIHIQRGNRVSVWYVNLVKPFYNIGTCNWLLSTENYLWKKPSASL